MKKVRFPARALAVPLPRHVRLQVCTASPEPPADDARLHEIKHDGHRLLVVADGDGGLRLVSRNGYDRTELFRAPFDGLAALGRDGQSRTTRRPIIS
jgi:ATP-dependent DNA ligase